LTWNLTQTAPRWVNVAESGLGVPAGPSAAPDSITLTLGYVDLPLTMGRTGASEEDPLMLGVEVVGRFLLSRDRAVEIADVLRQSVTKYDQITNRE
jgi:hypothetical protein